MTPSTVVGEGLHLTQLAGDLFDVVVHGEADGLPGAVRQFILDPMNPRVLYAATLNDGIYTFTQGR